MLIGNILNMLNKYLSYAIHLSFNYRYNGHYQHTKHAHKYNVHCPVHNAMIGR